jgi:hypothetical protein
MNAAVGSLVVIDIHTDAKVLWNGVLLDGATINKCGSKVTIITPTPKDKVFDEVKQAGIKVKGVKVNG